MKDRKKERGRETRQKTNLERVRLGDLYRELFGNNHLVGVPPQRIALPCLPARISEILGPDRRAPVQILALIGAD
jgi:hypothetical protein